VTALENAAPIIVTALLGREDFAWADALRRAHFPPERNFLRAHITLFHHLPPSVERELCALLKDEARGVVPMARLAAPFSLGGGVAYRIDSPDLQSVRAHIADRFAPLLMPQDKAGWRPHVTVQNKVKADVARTLLATLAHDYAPRPLAMAGLAAWWYRGGPWEPIGAWAFGSGHAIKPPC
jgi:2'-5' RNA ligase superfamily